MCMGNIVWVITEKGLVGFSWEKVVRVGGSVLKVEE